jgi:hypothetical protein
MMAQHPYGSGYQEHYMAEPFYADTYRYTTHDHISNQTAYENDTPSDYSVEASPIPGSLAQRYGLSQF